MKTSVQSMQQQGKAMEWSILYLDSSGSTNRSDSKRRRAGRRGKDEGLPRESRL